MSQNIKTLLKKYKYDFIHCESCGGRVIRDGELVCSECGLIQGKILDSVKNPYSHVGESEYHKYNREANHDRKLHKLDLNKSKFTNIRILKSAGVKLTEYCKKNKLTKYLFISEIILKEISE
ncbi:hypothetical protein LCGC14_1542990 [marine sediment metagenome]|uniref:Uncharacterized protein n=1 Tax=marine sediment metagenome TaxID=412755 RepID=A0A0F9L8L0_9ZZZZ